MNYLDKFKRSCSSLNSNLKSNSKYVVQLDINCDTFGASNSVQLFSKMSLSWFFVLRCNLDEEKNKEIAFSPIEY